MGSLSRVKDLSEQDFLHNHLAPRRPVIVTDEVSSWPAVRLWTWDYLVERFGDLDVDLYNDWFEPTGVSSFADFVNASIGVAEPDLTRSYVRWFARNGVDDGRWADDVFDALATDWSAPSFLPTNNYVVPAVDAVSRATAERDRFPYRALFASSAGAHTRLHLDPWSSSAVLCQVVGSKRVTMFSPVRHQEMLRLADGSADGRRPAGVTPDLIGELHAGEVLFVPAGWWHYVDTLTDSVSLTWNFVHAIAAEDLRQHVAEHPDDPELSVVAYFLGDTERASKDVATLVAGATRRLGPIS